MRQTILVAIFSLQLFHAFPAQAGIFDDVLEFLKPAEGSCAWQVVSSEQGQGENKKKQGETEAEPDCE